MAGIQCQAGATQLEKHFVMRCGKWRKDSKGSCLLVTPPKRTLMCWRRSRESWALMSRFSFSGAETLRPERYLRSSVDCLGAYSQFDAASAAQLKELLQAVAAYALADSRPQAISAGASGEVRLLEQQLRT